MCASYSAQLWSQSFAYEGKRWIETEFSFASDSKELFQVVDPREWLETLPDQPAKRRLILEGIGTMFGREKEVSFWTASAGLKNAEFVQNKLQLLGWLNAAVHPRWLEGDKGATLELNVECGARWFIDSIAVDANHSGFSEVELQNWLELKPGMPFEKESLLSAQENLAFELQSRGYATFNTTHVRFLVDTTGRNVSDGLVLSLRCEPWEPAQSLGLSFDDTLKTPGYNHPLVHFGKITWNGGHRGAELRPGGVRQEVWGHVSSTQPEAKYDPLAVQSNYERLSRLNSIGRVQLSSNLRLDSSTALVAERVVSGVVMDIDFSLIPKPTHDVGFELDMIRNDARYGPRVSSTLLHRNPRGWGAQNAWEVGFGYVSVSPFSSLNQVSVLNSAEWTIRWKTSQIGIRPLPLATFRPSTEPYTTIDVGWDHEVWPEFTRSQIHLEYDFGFTENPARESKFHVTPLDLSFVNLTNRADEFEQWLNDQLNPLVRSRFNNHFTLGSAASWESQWDAGPWRGIINVQAHWAGMLAQKFAENFSSIERFDESTGAWLVAPGVPLIQYQSGLLNLSATSPTKHRISHAWHILVGWANAGKNTPSLPLERAFFTGGANGVRGWRIRALGPGNAQNLSDNGIVLGVGDVRVDLQYEWRYSTENNWQFAGFTDAGNVWLHGAEASPGEAWAWGDFSSWGWSAGAGIRYDLEFFILRLDAAARLHDPTQPAGIRWLGQSGFNGSIHLGLGLPF